MGHKVVFSWMRTTKTYIYTYPWNATHQTMRHGSMLIQSIKVVEIKLNCQYSGETRWSQSGMDIPYAINKVSAPTANGEVSLAISN